MTTAGHGRVLRRCLGGASEEGWEEASEEWLESCETSAHDGYVGFDGGPDEEVGCVPC